MKYMFSRRSGCWPMRVMKQSRLGACAQGGGRVSLRSSSEEGRVSDVDAPIRPCAGRGSRRRCAPRWRRAVLRGARIVNDSHSARGRRERGRTRDDAVEDPLLEAHLLIRVPRPRQAPQQPLLALAPPARRKPKPSRSRSPSSPTDKPAKARRDRREPRPALESGPRRVDERHGREAVLLVDGLPHARRRRPCVPREALGVLEQVDVDALGVELVLEDAEVAVADLGAAGGGGLRSEGDT